MVTDLHVRTVSPAEQDRAVSTIVMAFSNDPIARWAYPDPHQYLNYFPSVVRAFAGRAFEHGSAYQVGDYLAAALWLPPGVGPDGDAMAVIFDESVTEAGKEELSAFAEQQEDNHPHDAHWYLPMIGVDPMGQGRGYGSALLNHALTVCDRESLPAFLEATSPRSRVLYERHGFEVVGEIQAGKSPPMWPMWRKPR